MTGPIRPGFVKHLWDHFVLDLSDGPSMAFLSLYAITYSPSVGRGHVALVAFDFGDGRQDALLSDDLSTAHEMQQRLRTIGYARSSVGVEPTEAQFTRKMGHDQMEFRIETDRSTLVATWSRLENAFQMWAPAPQLVVDEDISAVFVEAAHGRLEVGGQHVDADSRMDDYWKSKVGRPLLACHAALAEVRVRPG